MVVSGAHDPNLGGSNPPLPIYYFLYEKEEIYYSVSIYKYFNIIFIIIHMIKKINSIKFLIHLFLWNIKGSL